VELFEQIRRARRDDPGVSVRELARRFGTHRRTVRDALVSAVPPQRKVSAPKAAPGLDQWKPIIDGWLLSGSVMCGRSTAASMRCRGWPRWAENTESGFELSCHVLGPRADPS
jgi:hypothetical protein